MSSCAVYQPLRRKGDFKRVFDHGLKFSSKNLVMYALPNELSTSRIGFSVSRKIGGAVVRNRVRRRLREILRATLSGCELKYDIVVVARQAAVDAAFAELSRTVEKFLLGFINEKRSHRDH